MSARFEESDWSDAMLVSERASRTIVSAASSRTPNTIPATAADRRPRQNRAVSLRGAVARLILGA